MDWIEKLFHISPDGGSGRLELIIVIGSAIAIGMVVAGIVKLAPAICCRGGRLVSRLDVTGGSRRNSHRRVRGTSGI